MLNRRTTSARFTRKTVTACTLLRVALSEMRVILIDGVYMPFAVVAYQVRLSMFHVDRSNQSALLATAFIWIIYCHNPIFMSDYKTAAFYRVNDITNPGSTISANCIVRQTHRE
jgi:hypothetical protein